jgi:phosphotriesterase-related protein
MRRRQGEGRGAGARRGASRPARGARMAQTVAGSVPADALGVTMMHEHLLIDTTPMLVEPREASRRTAFHAPLTVNLLGRIRYGGLTNVDNSRLGDVQVAIEEAMLYKQAGGRTIVDATCIGIGRDPRGLLAVAQATGLHVVMGCSYYVTPGGSAELDAKSEDAIVEEIRRDLLDGVAGTGIRAGIIGEVGCSWPLSPSERKVLRASGRAQRLTGAALLVHPGRNEHAPEELIEVLREVNTDLSRTVMCHLDRTVAEQATLKRLAATGCMLEYDLFGNEFSYYRPNPDFDMPSDAQRLAWIAWLVAEGYGNQLLMAHDIALKHSLVRYGGYGYAHILENIVPRMRRKGFREEQIHRMLVESPRRLLAFHPG